MADDAAPAPDPYLAWASGPVISPSQGADSASPPTLEQMYPHAADPMPAMSVPAAMPDVPAAPAAASPGLAPGLGVPQAMVDGYPGWAAGPVTTPGQGPAGGPAELAGPITSPAEISPGGPPNASGGSDAFGGNVDPSDRAKAITQMSPAQQAAAVDSMSPDEFQRYQATRNRAMVLKQAELEHSANAESERRARDDLQDQRASVAKADADTKDLMASANVLANTKIDNDRFVRHLGVGGSIAAVALSALGGATAGATGGHNGALEAFNSKINNDIAAQHADLANQWKGVETKRSAIAQQYERHGDLYKAQETYRVAAYQAALGNMQSELQQYDPAGGTASYIRGQMDQFHGAQAQAVNAFAQQQFKNHLDATKEQRESALAQSTIDKNRNESSLGWAKLADEKEKRVLLTPEQIRAANPLVPVEALPTTPMTAKDVKQHFDTYNAGLEVNAKTRETAVQEAATVVRNPVTGATLGATPGEKGRLRPEDAAKLTDEIGKRQSAVDTLAGLRRDLDAGIGTWDYAKWAGYRTQLSLGKTDFIQSLGSKVSSREMDAVADIFGDDFDHFTSRVTSREAKKSIASIDAVIDHAKQSTQTDLVQRGLAKPDDPSIIRDTSRPAKHVETPDERAAKEVLQNPQKEWDGARVIREMGVEDEIGKGTSAALRAAQDKLHQIGGVMPSQKNTIDAWLADATGADERKRAAALANLTNTARDAEVPAVRIYARDALTGVIAPGVAEPKESQSSTPTNDQATAREQLPWTMR